MSGATCRRRGITLRRLYGEGLGALLTIVRRGVPAPSLQVGPYQPFLELIEQNLRDWKQHRGSRGHMVGMGMGSIYDVGGPSPRAPAVEREGFARYDEALRWTHNVTYSCAEHWDAKQRAGEQWTRADDRKLVAELMGPDMTPYLSAVCCRKCPWTVTKQTWVACAAVALETPYRLQLLVDLGGDAFARRMLRPPTGQDRARQHACQARLAELAVAQGLTVRRSSPRGDICPRCGAATIGTTVTLSLD